MALSGCSNREISDYFNCDEGTIRKRFSAILTKARAERAWTLRRQQTALAKKRNATMLIWLGKNELSQSDRQTHEHTGKDGGPIEHKHVITPDEVRKSYEDDVLSQRGRLAHANGNGKSVHPAA
jgi:hypothetical protein